MTGCLKGVNIAVAKRILTQFCQNKIIELSKMLLNEKAAFVFSCKVVTERYLDQWREH